MEMTKPETLLSFEAGDTVRVVRIDAGHALKRRLLALGLVPGAPVYILDKNHGPMTLCIHNSRLAVGREMARRIFAEPAPALCPTCGAEGPCAHRA